MRQELSFRSTLHSRPPLENSSRAQSPGHREFLCLLVKSMASPRLCGSALNLGVKPSCSVSGSFKSRILLRHPRANGILYRRAGGIGHRNQPRDGGHKGDRAVLLQSGRFPTVIPGRGKNPAPGRWRREQRLDEAEERRISHNPGEQERHRLLPQVTGWALVVSLHDLHPIKPLTMLSRRIKN